MFDPVHCYEYRAARHSDARRYSSGTAEFWRSTAIQFRETDAMAIGTLEFPGSAMSAHAYRDVYRNSEIVWC